MQATVSGGSDRPRSTRPSSRSSDSRRTFKSNLRNYTATHKYSWAKGTSYPRSGRTTGSSSRIAAPATTQPQSDQHDQPAVAEEPVQSELDVGPCQSAIPRSVVHLFPHALAEPLGRRVLRPARELSGPVDVQPRRRESTSTGRNRPGERFRDAYRYQTNIGFTQYIDGVLGASHQIKSGFENWYGWGSDGFDIFNDTRLRYNGDDAQWRPALRPARDLRVQHAARSENEDAELRRLRPGSAQLPRVSP